MPYRPEPSPITAYYDASTDYDTVTAGVGWQRVNEHLTNALDLERHPIPAPHCLDLGAGTGQTIETLIKHDAVDGLSTITAIDISGNMLATLRKKNLHPNIETVQTDAGHYLANSDARFDIITAIGWLEFIRIEKMRAMLGAMTTRLLRQNGVVIFTYRPCTQEQTTGNVFEQYLWPQDSVEAILAQNGIATYYSSIFTAYRIKNDPGKPVTYHMLAGKRAA